MKLYRELLVEIKYRVEAIGHVIDAKLLLRDKIAEELCYLQLRMICETIAIGCLIIHQDVSSKRTDLFKTYKADWIMKELDKLHNKFYPTPLESSDSPADQNGVPGWIHKSDGFLTKSDLSALWARAGGKLHRGSAKNVINSKLKLSFSDVRTSRDKIISLLNRHIIISPDEETICYFIMNDGQDNVHSALFQKIN